jgi:hypothetical protein
MKVIVLSLVAVAALPVHDLADDFATDDSSNTLLPIGQVKSAGGSLNSSDVLLTPGTSPPPDLPLDWEATVRGAESTYALLLAREKNESAILLSSSSKICQHSYEYYPPWDICHMVGSQNADMSEEQFRKIIAWAFDERLIDTQSICWRPSCKA